MQHGNPSPQDVVRVASRLGRELDARESGGLATYLGLLETWNRKMNLVGPSRWPDMLADLVADSWHLADLLRDLGDAEDLAKSGSSLDTAISGPNPDMAFPVPGLPSEPVTFDFGAGAGIPGVPLRLFWSAGQYLLVEPRAKRAGFLRQCLAELRLPGTRVFEGRAEALAGQRADICLSRAFQPWRDFLETARGFWRQAGPADGAAFPGLAVVFAGEPQPEGSLPEGYSLVASRPYPCRGKTGYFWVFAPVSAARSESLKMSLVAS